MDVPFQEYVDEFLRPQSADALGSGESQSRRRRDRCSGNALVWFPVSWLCFVKLVFLFSLIYSSFLGFVIFCLILNIFGHFAFFKKDFLVYSYFLVLIVCISSHLVMSYLFI